MQSRPKINAVSLFIDGDSRLHQTHPFNKLSYILLIGVCVYLLPGGWLKNIILLLINLGILLGAGVFNAAWKVVWKTMLPLAMFMSLIHGTLYPENHTILINLKWFNFYQEGVVFASTTLLQLLILLTASLLFVFTTHPADLINTISQTAGSPALAYLIGSPLILLPAMGKRIETIQSAQRSRGLDTQGNLLKRFSGLSPLITPLVLGSLMEVEQRSTALELRGFKSRHPKTSVRIVPGSIGQRNINRFMLIVTACIIGYRIFR